MSRHIPSFSLHLPESMAQLSRSDRSGARAAAHRRRSAGSEATRHERGGDSARHAARFPPGLRSRRCTDTCRPRGQARGTGGRCSGRKRPAGGALSGAITATTTRISPRSADEPEFKAVFADIERDMAQQRARLAARPKDAPLDLADKQ